MPSLVDVLKRMGINDLSTATQKDYKKAAEILRRQQEEKWDHTNPEEWGFTGQTVEQQRTEDEAKNPSGLRGPKNPPRGPENKG